MEYTYTDFNEFEIDGLSFNIPSDYKLNATGENGDVSFNEYVVAYNYTSGSSRDIHRTTTTKHAYIEIYVYKNNSLQQVVSSISTEEWDVNNVSHGSYSGYKVGRFGDLRNWFIFEKEGKIVSIYYEREAIEQNMEKIIS